MERTRTERLRKWAAERRRRLRQESIFWGGAAAIALFILVYGAMLDVHLGLGAGSLTGYAEFSAQPFSGPETKGSYGSRLRYRMRVNATLGGPVIARFNVFKPGFFLNVRKAMKRAGYDRWAFRPIAPVRDGLNSGRALPIPRCRIHYAGLGRRVATGFEVLPP